MSTPASGMEDALSQAGNNRNEWFRVIRRYQDGNDTLKLQAALFLIENMTDKFYFTGKVIDEYETFIDSVYRIRQAEYDIPAIYDEFRTKAKNLTQEPDVCRDIRTLPADFPDRAYRRSLCRMEPSVEPASELRRVLRTDPSLPDRDGNTRSMAAIISGAVRSVGRVGFHPDSTAGMYSDQ